MGLSTFNTAVRYFLLFVALATIGFNVYFVWLYFNYTTIVFTWKFYSQFSLVGFIFFFILISEIEYRVSGRRHRRSATAPEYSDHDDKSHYRDHHHHRRSSRWTMFWSVARILVVWTASVGILNATVSSIPHQERFILSLPFPRDSAQGQALNNKFDAYDPHNLFDCPVIQLPDLLTTLCAFDQTTIDMAIVVALLAIIEAVLTFILVKRANKSVGGGHPGLESGAAAHKEVALEPQPLLQHQEQQPQHYDAESQHSAMKKRSEIYDNGTGETYNDKFTAPAAHTNVERGSSVMEMLPFDNEMNHQNRELPPLPVRSNEEVPYYPFSDSEKYEYEESEAGPSHVYQADIKRHDGF
ncbi:hypothetical protein BGZ99_004318 [Dissophora globulifera]|uniref:Uncharacterized protein n=1 Tax=Dissophora globulifera TaxID=979702 RepID=A0A9P6RTB3_9FUNG|nr:hypothetical protein BGZ99_004318 [Dissophora globulifera]